MVEEMMLLANVTVAEHVLSCFAGCTLLRRHQVPPPRQFEPLLKAAHAAHFSLDISSSKVGMRLACPCYTSLDERS
jgi:exosome complex exonuclease DIS3/RRP44